MKQHAGEDLVCHLPLPLEAACGEVTREQALGCFLLLPAVL